MNVPRAEQGARPPWDCGMCPYAGYCDQAGRCARAKAVGISNEPLSDAQMARAIQRSKAEGWKDITP